MEMTKYKLGDVAKTGSGGTPKSTVAEYYENGNIPWINSGELNNPFISTTSNFITQKGYDNSSAKLFPPQTVLLAMYGATAGKASLLEFEACTNQAICAIMPNQDILLPRFLKYKLDTMYNYLVGLSTGSARDNLSQDGIKALELCIPPLSEQKKIAAVLSALDDKIALNKKMNQKLEAMAKRLYDYWFVQYDFPDKNGHPYKTTGGPMTYNATLKREIPVGWEVVDINELCQVVDCLHSKKPDYCYEDENSYLLALENITKEGYIDLSDKYYISKEDFAEWTSRICVKENDFLFTNAGRAGDMGMVPEGVLCAIGRNITAVRPEKINPWYLRCFFKSLYMQEQILNNLDQGSFFMSFNVRSIKKLQVLMPSEPLMKKFVSFIEPHLKRIEKNNKEISRLTALRDKLLPLLMNGQVVVG